MSARWLRRVLAVVLMCSMAAAPRAIAAPSEQVPVGPRAVAMGSAFSSIADDGTALFWNPAGLVRIGHQEIIGARADLFGSGIKDNFASFVLPLSPDQASAIDWYHSGFDDGELGFGENRVDLGYAVKLRPWFLAGANGKLITRNTDLDGTNVRHTQGFGMDLGMMAVPTEHVHLGLVAQDAFGTRMKDSEGVSEVAYPRNLRAAASYNYGRWGTLAMDVDDRWHMGLEVTPLDAVALRLGMEDDRTGSESATWTYGIGLKTGFLRVEYARVEPPTLQSTDHFSLAMEFNFNPALVRVERVRATDIYNSLYKSYAREPFGTVQLRNLQDRPLSTRLSVYVPELMNAPSEQDVILRPLATQEMPLTGVFGDRALNQRGDRPIQVQVTASYQSKRLVRHEQGAARCVAYAPGAICWGGGVAQAAAFITTRDPAVDALARAASRLVANRERNPLRNRNLSFAAAMTDAVAELGVTYLPDPNTPYAVIAEKPQAVDTIHYPYQTLEHRSGDCDDTTVLMASLLGNVGVETRLVDAPGHIFLLFATGVHERNQSALAVDEKMYVVADQEVWVPLETTALGRGFAAAWQAGAEEYQTWSKRGELTVVDVTEAQTRYEPVVPPGDRKPMALDTTRVSARVDREAQEIGKWREEYITEHFDGARSVHKESAGAQIELARVFFMADQLESARAKLEQALDKDPRSTAALNDLGVVLAGVDSLAAAERSWQAALDLGDSDPGIWINLGLSRYVRGDTLGAGELLARGLAGAGGYDAACGLLALPPDNAADRGSGAPTDAQTRAMVRTALQRVPAQEIAKAEKGGQESYSVPTLRAPKARGAATRGELHRYLYWKEH